MTKADAHNILDARRAGALVPEHVINRALELTGDCAPVELINEKMYEETRNVLKDVFR